MHFGGLIFYIFNIANNDAMISKQSMVLRQKCVAVTLIHFEKRRKIPYMSSKPTLTWRRIINTHGVTK